MKRIGFLFDKAFSRESLYEAYLTARKGKRMKRACFNFERRLAVNLDRLYDELQAGTYKPQPYYSFLVYEPKERRIYAPSFCDLVVQHAIYRVIYPIFDRTFIDQSFSCRKGKGTHKCADYAQAAIQSSPKGTYSLKMDIRRYFYRINRDVLRVQIENKIKDKRFVDLMMMFADYGEPVGIPIGNLLSQTYALIYLNGLDHHIKRDLGVKRYCRYVDDFVVFGESKDRCEEILYYVRVYIKDLGLELSKYTIAPLTRGVNFVGYRTWASKRFIRKHSMFKFSRALKKRKLESVISILGHAKRTQSLSFLTRKIRSTDNVFFLRLPKTYRQRQNAGVSIPS